MCKFWKREKCNHHFPELNKRNDFRTLLKLCLKPLIAGPVLLVIVFLLSFFYLIQTNINATKGYQIKNLEEQLTLLQKDNKKLRLDYIELQSMASIIDKTAQLNLVPVGNVQVLIDGGISMALK